LSEIAVRWIVCRPKIKKMLGIEEDFGYDYFKDLDAYYPGIYDLYKSTHKVWKKRITFKEKIKIIQKNIL